jgi:hypothetical protein
MNDKGRAMKILTRRLVLLSFSLILGQAYGQQTVTVSIGHSTEISWWAQTGRHYLVQSSDNLISNWVSFAPMRLGNNLTNRFFASLSSQTTCYYRVVQTTNKFCNETHPAVGRWRGTAFTDYYYFFGDGTVTTRVYQWHGQGTWLPTSPSTLVFAIYRNDDGGRVHASLVNPILGTIHGTNMNFLVNGETWMNYAQRF